MEHTTVAIIGGGVLGLATAEALTRSGVDVCVLDKSTIGSGVTGSSVGVVETQYIDEADIALRAKAVIGFRRLVRDHNLSFTRTGYLRLARSDDAADAFARSSDSQRAHGLAGVKVLTPEEIGRLIPGIETAGIVAGLWGQNDGYVDPHELCQILAASIRASGGRIFQRTLVTEHVRSTHHLLTTSRGLISADIVVNAAGVDAGRVATLLGQHLDTTAETHHVLRIGLDTGSKIPLPSVVDYVPNGQEAGLWLRPDGHGELLSGLHVEAAPTATAAADSRPPEDLISHWTERFVELFPLMADARYLGSWAGQYPRAARGLLAGPLDSDQSLITAAGGGAYGLQVAPAVGEQIADSIAQWV